MWLVGAFFFASCSLLATIFLCWWTYSQLSKKLDTAALTSSLEAASQELQSKLEKRVRAIEVEWEDTWDKFMRLTGRMERLKQRNSVPSVVPGTVPVGPAGDGTQNFVKAEVKQRLKRLLSEQKASSRAARL